MRSPAPSRAITGGPDGDARHLKQVHESQYSHKNRADSFFTQRSARVFVLCRGRSILPGPRLLRSIPAYTNSAGLSHYLKLEKCDSPFLTKAVS